MRNPRQISVYRYWFKGMRCPRVFSLRQDMGRSVSRQVIASPVVHGWLMVWAKRVVVVVMLYESGWLRGFPTSTLIMPFFNMFKSRRGRSTSLPRAPERYLHEFDDYNQASPYGPRSTGFGRSAQLAQPHAGFRAQRNPSHGSSISNSVPERYAESPTNDQVRTTACHISHPNVMNICLFTTHCVTVLVSSGASRLFRLSRSTRPGP